jgi:hypothetical protein
LADEAAMLTEGVTGFVTVMSIVFDVAVVGLAQESEDVITTETASPCTNELLL